MQDRTGMETATAAETLRPYGQRWVDGLGRAYFTLNEDRKYLPNIVQRLLAEARSNAMPWSNQTGS
jgi:hypothetical protein